MTLGVSWDIIRFNSIEKRLAPNRSFVRAKQELPAVGGWREPTHFPKQRAFQRIPAKKGSERLRAAWEAGMLRVVCGECGKKLEIPDAWAHNVVKCPQCRQPIDMEERDSAECAVKLGQFLNENLGADEAAGTKKGPAKRSSSSGSHQPSPFDLAWAQVQAFAQRHRMVVGCAAGALALIMLDATWLHTGTLTAGAIAGVFAAAAAWNSEMRSRLPTAARRAEIEYKVALGLIALLGLRLAYFAYSEIMAIVSAENLETVSP
ncbi:MAG TPA: hypothetical protein VMF30_17205, partial [Pirellulales bacterium]|nr:hypothetical protein [Pirellulales bacterium]